MIKVYSEVNYKEKTNKTKSKTLKEIREELNQRAKVFIKSSKKTLDDNMIFIEE